MNEILNTLSSWYFQAGDYKVLRTVSICILIQLVFTGSEVVAFQQEAESWNLTNKQYIAANEEDDEDDEEEEAIDYRDRVRDVKDWIHRRNSERKGEIQTNNLAPLSQHSELRHYEYKSKRLDRSNINKLEHSRILRHKNWYIPHKINHTYRHKQYNKFGYKKRNHHYSLSHRQRAEGKNQYQRKVTKHKYDEKRRNHHWNQRKNHAGDNIRNILSIANSHNGLTHYNSNLFKRNRKKHKDNIVLKEKKLRNTRNPDRNEQTLHRRRIAKSKH